MKTPQTKTKRKKSQAVRNAYSDWAKTYDEDRNLTRDLDQIITQRLLAPRRWKSIIEAGCGTGKNTPLFSRIGERIVALDFTKSMIEKAREKVTRLSLTNVTFKVADLTDTWPSKSDTVDLVAFNLVLEHIADLKPVFSEASRCLKNGGTLFVSELHPYRQYLGTKARFERTDGTKQIDAFVHNISEFLEIAKDNQLKCESLNEWRHEEDPIGPPRLISFEFRKT